MTQEESCSVVCDSNLTAFVQQYEEEKPDARVKLVFLSTPLAQWIEPIAERFMASKNYKVDLQFIRVPNGDLHEDIVNEAQSKVGLYDGFLTPPEVIGSVALQDGWADLKPFIQESQERAQDWADIMLGYRRFMAQYENKILLFPLDGDMLSMYYRKDILEHFGLKVPRTWDEYVQVAEVTHGKMYENQTLSGSCVGRGPRCASAYWANLHLASITQTKGQATGHLFDPDNMEPLTGKAVEKALEWMEREAAVGSSDEFSSCIGLNRIEMNAGKCVLSYNWGNNFKVYLHEGSKLRGRYGVAPTPGSEWVLDRDSKELVKCDDQRCPYGKDFDDIGRVNYAPYLAYGGWACAANNYTDPRKKRLAIEFCYFASSREVSRDIIIGNATDPDNIGGGDPFRRSHLDESIYVENGYELDTTKEYLATIREGIDSPNAVTDIRFPTAASLNNVLGDLFLQHLNDTKTGNILQSGNRAEEARRLVASAVTQKFNDIILEHEALAGSEQPSLLEQYQRLRGVYSVQHEYNHLGDVKIFGYALVGVIAFCAIVFAVWTWFNREKPVTRASQPVFLVMICFGALLLGSTIIPMSIDDGSFSSEACNRACMTIPWLLALGWTIVFSALFSKLWRLNRIMKSSMQCQRVQVTEMDVLKPFVGLLLINLALMLAWTLTTPLEWVRISTSETSSYGTCSVEDDGPGWKILVSFVILANGISLILACIQAYLARNISTEYSESSWIAMVIGSVFQIMLVAVPLSFLVHDNPTASYFLRSFSVFVVAMSVLLLIFVPKIWSTYFPEPPSKVPAQNAAPAMNLPETAQHIDDPSA